MADIDVFAGMLLDEAKRFLEKASITSDSDGQNANLHASVMLGFCAFEAHVNAIADELGNLTDLSVHEKALLLEREVRMSDGQFVMSESLKMTRLEDRLQFLHRRFAASPLDRSVSWWSELMNAVKMRNYLTHPKANGIVISKEAVRRALQAIIDSLDAMFQVVYKKKFPAAGRGLQSKMTF